MTGLALCDAQDQILAARFDILSKGGNRGRMVTRREGALQSSYCRRLSTHEFRDLRLCQAGLLACLEQSIQQSGLVSLDTFNFSAYARTAHKLLYQLIMCLHV